MIITLIGTKRVGKTTAAKVIELLYDFERVDIVKPAKIQLANQCNITLEEIEKNKHLYRQQLIDMVAYTRKMYGQDILTREAVKYSKGKNIIIESIRHKGDFDYLNNFTNSIFIKINRNLPLEEDNVDDIFELGDIKFKYIIDNNYDKEYLCQRIIDIMQKINNEVAYA